MLSCCNRRRKTEKRCLRKDGRVFKLPRRFTRRKCIKGPVRGFSMKSSCAPYKYCRSKKTRFLYNPEDPKRYTNKIYNSRGCEGYHYQIRASLQKW